MNYSENVGTILRLPFVRPTVKICLRRKSLARQSLVSATHTLAKACTYLA